VDGNELLTSRLFGGLAAGPRDAIARRLIPVEVDDGEAVVTQDEPAQELLLVVEGRLAVWQRESEDGLEYARPDLSVGDDLGLAATLRGEPQPFSAWACGTVRLLALPRAALLALAQERSEISAALTAALAERLHRAEARTEARVVDLARLRTDESLWGLLPRHLIAKRRALPLAQRGSVLVVGFVDPTDTEALEEVRQKLPGVRVRAVALAATDFERFYRARVAPVLDHWRPEESGDTRWFTALQAKSYEVRMLDGTAETVPAEERGKHIHGDEIVALTNRLIGEALELSASDIHIEPGPSLLTVRYRVDGRLKKRPEPLELRYHSPIVSRFKVLARMDIAERRKPQDGRLAIAWGTREIDFRLATVPTRFGEKLVLRILDPASILIDLERLIPHEPTYRSVRSMIDQPQGMVIVAGPTGSGKTTTLYSAMLRRREDEVNIVTIEDPIEYTIHGVSQVQVNEPAGVSFATAVRHFLRQDPDIILVGETRDPQTAATSVEAALTGHLVLTTLHANDALATLVRLRDMGIEPFLLASTVIGVVSQRLVRRLCPHCAEPATYHRELITPLGLYAPDETPEMFEFAAARGCIHCNYQGFRGRVGVFEALRVDDTLRPLVASDAPVPELRRLALQRGLLLPLEGYCRHLLTRGFTTPEEVGRVLFSRE
jgi:type IV pilus assembly protein PilB